MKKAIPYSILWLVLSVIGVLLLVYMIVYEDEPGALPAILILSGAGGYFIQRRSARRIRKGN